MERKEFIDYTYEPGPSLASFIALPHISYGEISLSPVEQKRIIENTAAVFNVRGFETLMDESIAGQHIPLLLKRKMVFGKPFEIWACFFHFSGEPVQIGEVDSILASVYALKETLLKRLPSGSYFSAVMISKSPFAPEASLLAEANGIETETFEQLFEKWIND